MKFLVDTSPANLKRIGDSPLIGGQLLTPLTGYSNAGGMFAIDNGAFSGFDAKSFERILKREQDNKDRCLFVTCPDIVGNARRTLELWQRRRLWILGWRTALVAQDGLEELEVPWDELDCLFVGGGDPWKDSKASMDLVRTAKTLGKHVHIGRVNTYARFKRFADIGADTCDGSGVAMYDHMLKAIEDKINGNESTLFDVIESTSNGELA